MSKTPFTSHESKNLSSKPFGHGTLDIPKDVALIRRPPEETGRSPQGRNWKGLSDRKSVV